MSVDTIVLAALGGADDLADRLTVTAADVADPSDAEIVFAHVFDEDEYETARSRLNLAADAEVIPTTIAERKATVRDLGDALAGRRPAQRRRLAGPAPGGARGRDRRGHDRPRRSRPGRPCSAPPHGRSWSDPRVR